MKKESLLRYGALASALLPVVPVCAKGKKGNASVDNRQQPNVIILYADDLGYGDLECFGATRVQTPNVNALAQSGIRFTNVHAIAATWSADGRVRFPPCGNGHRAGQCGDDYPP